MTEQPDTQNVSRQTVPAGTDGGIARRALVLPEGLPWSTPAALHHIADRRLHQIAIGYTPEHDDRHTPLEWADLLGTLLEGVHFAARSAAVPKPPGYRQALLDLAAVATAAVEVQDRLTASELRTALTEPKREASSGAPQAQPEEPEGANRADNSDTRPSDTEPPEAA
jgi:hypothetical protein